MPKNPSPLQSEASRSNGSKGRGPLAPETKRISAQNARKTDLYTKTVALPHEEQTWSERSKEWHSYYKPQSPAAKHLTSECAHATLLSDRSHLYRQGQIDLQTKAERRKFETARNQKRNRLANQVRAQPQSTLPAAHDIWRRHTMDN